MKHLFIFLIFLITLSSNISQTTPPEVENICPQGCKKYQVCDPIQQKCVYKGFFPIYTFEFFQLLVYSFTSFITSISGIGVGGVFSSLLLSIQDFQTFEAFPTSSFFILCLMTIIYINRLVDKIKNPYKVYINYELVIMMAPAIIFGVKIGTILNKILNSLLLIIVNLIILVNCAINQYYLIITRRSEETNELIESSMKEKNNLDEPLIPNSKRKLTLKEIMENDTKPNLSQDALSTLKQEQKPIKLNRLLFILFLILLIILDQLVEGNLNLNSYFGFARCSRPYWLTFIGFILLLIIIAFLGYFLGYNSLVDRNNKINIEYSTVNIEVLKGMRMANLLKGFLCGLLSSSVGVSGGFMIEPIFTSFGLKLDENIATSNFLMVITNLSTVIFYFCAGQIQWSYSLWAAIPCIICSAIGCTFVFNYIDKNNKYAIFLVIMLYLMIFSIAIMTIVGFIILFTQPLLNIISINDYCY